MITEALRQSRDEANLWLSSTEPQFGRCHSWRAFADTVNAGEIHAPYGFELDDASPLSDRARDDLGAGVGGCGCRRCVVGDRIQSRRAAHPGRELLSLSR